MHQTGLFLGAGASYELGMPLVWDVTIELKKWLLPEKLITLNYNWKLQGGGYPDNVVNDLIGAIKRPNFHYEAILGHLETQLLRNTSDSQFYHGIYSWLVEVVYIILQERHTKNLDYIQKKIRYFQGFQSLIREDSPLWIFSLNHDLVVECLAAHFGIAVKTGFGPEVVTLPRRNKQGVKIGELRAEVFSGEQLQNGVMSFFGPKSAGINLLKIHGALDVFTFRDGKDLLKILPEENSIVGIIESLRSANEDLHFLNRQMPSRPIKTTNEINYEDDNGEMQFLRRSLLSGAYKFDNKMSQVLPAKIFDHFRFNLNYITRLICVGYGFGDSHIDQALRDWLAGCPERRLEIVNPRITETPSRLLHLEPQISILQIEFSDYLDSVAGIKRDRRDILEKKMAVHGRKNQHNPEKKKELETFIETFLAERNKALSKQIEGLPIVDGDIDITSTGMTAEEIARQFTESNPITIEELMEKFLDKQSKDK
jgi:hypothetical protein